MQFMRNRGDENMNMTDMDQIISFLKAEAEAFEKADLDVGKVEFACPVCGGKAVGNRYWYGGRAHGLGSGCTKCGIRHS